MIFPDSIIAFTLQMSKSLKSGVFAGAYPSGGICQMSNEEPFPAYRDVDLIAISTDEALSNAANLELDLDGIMLEVGFFGIERFLSAEAMLADPEFAPNLADTIILADPQGILEPLQVAVASSFTKRDTVIARCENEKQRVLGSLGALRSVQAADEIIAVNEVIQD